MDTATAVAIAATSAGAGSLTTTAVIYLIGEWTATGRHHATTPPRQPMPWFRRPRPGRHGPSPHRTPTTQPQE